MKHPAAQQDPPRPSMMIRPTLKKVTKEDKQSSFAARVVKAGDDIATKELWGIFCLVVFSLTSVYSLSYLLMQYLFPSEDTTTTDSSQESMPSSAELLGIPTNVPLYTWTDREFISYVAMVQWVTMVLTGLGTEMLVWLMFVRGGWDEDRENQWRLAQFFFPLLTTTTVGLANSQNYFALPLLVVTMWKFGFPETVLKLHTALYDKDSSSLVRVVNLFSGVGTVIHHSAAALYVAAVLTNLLPRNRFVLQVTVPLMMQHWFVLLRYNYNLVYVVLVTIVEVWFEWTALTLISYFQKLHWAGGFIGCGMLLAHWLYYIAGALSLFVAKEEYGTDDDATAIGSSKRYFGESFKFHSGDNTLERLKSFKRVTFIDQGKKKEDPWVKDDNFSEASSLEA